MHVTCFLFLILWLGYVWAWRGGGSSPPKAERIRVNAPIVEQNCSTHEVPCIDDCSFLCIEKRTQCVGGICQPEKALRDIRCNEKTGGVKVMVKDPVPHWTCVCSDSRFFGGDACDELHPDVCERGMFIYKARARYLCMCPPPFELIKIDSKPHCVDEKMMGFYDERTMSQSLF